MTKQRISNGTVHKVPKDMYKEIAVDKRILSKWESLTPLARNEWICWVISVQKAETRNKHIQQMKSQLKEGKRRPCCWIGCVHRADKAVSPSVQGVLARRYKTKR